MMPEWLPSARRTDGSVDDLEYAQQSVDYRGSIEKKQDQRQGSASWRRAFPNYYPPVIDLTTFEAAQTVRQENLRARRGRKGALITNLFASIATCMYCRSIVKLHNAKAKSLICKKVHDRKGCVPSKWTYTDFEEMFLQHLLKADPNFRPCFETLQRGAGWKRTRIAVPNARTGSCSRRSDPRSAN